MTLLVFDYIIIGVVLLVVILSAIKGFLRQFFGFIGILGGFYAASQFYYLLVGLPQLKIDNPVARNVVAFTAVFIAAFLVSIILSFWVRKALKAVGLSWLDHTVGALIGLFYGAVGVILLTVVFMRFPVLNVNNFFFQSIITLKTVMVFNHVLHSILS